MNRIRRDPAGASDLETGGQIEHFLFGAGAAMEQNPGTLRQAPGLARLAQAEHRRIGCHSYCLGLSPPTNSALRRETKAAPVSTGPAWAPAAHTVT
jgi:hypothetical protein